MTPAAHFFRALPVSGKGLALLGSLSVHAAIALAAVRGAPHAALNASLPADAILELTTIDLPLTEALLPPARGPASARATHHHDYAVPPNQDATPHDASLRHALPVPSVPNLAAAAPPSVLDSPAPATPHFVLTVAPTPHAASGISAGSGSAETANASAPAEPAAEASVDTPAKLRAGSSPSYTREAEAAGVEADVPLEIIVDDAGSVIGARALSHVGYGLDEAALRSVRGYRFSPARRGGKALAVRMHWLMRFQLR